MGVTGTMKKKPTKKRANSKTAQKKAVVLVPKFKARGQYRIVESDANNIMPSSMDNRTEDEVLNPSRRARLLDITRNLIRNSSLFNTIIGQMTTNVVSTCGGKVILSIPNEQTNKDIKRSFYAWTRNADFHTGDSFNHLLKRVLREWVVGGDVVLLFDDGLIEDSGKLLMFESNELVDVAPEEVEKRFGAGSWISQGKIYNKNGRHVGTVVSKSQVNMIGGLQADPNSCYFLRKDPNASPLDNYWFQFSNNWRRGRGVTPAASAVATIHQLEDLVQSELLASRMNSQLFCWLVQKKDEGDVPVPMAFEEDADIEDMTDEQVKAAVEEVKENERVVELRRARESSIGWEQLPEGFEAQQVATSHPNQSVEVMVNFLANRCAATLGLSRVYATGNPSDTDYRANQLFSWPAIAEFQKALEQVCDWVFHCYVNWAVKKGIVKGYVAEDFMDYVDWDWRKMDDFDQLKEQQAIEMKLRNMTSTLKEEIGSDWKEQLEQYKYEIDWCKKNGLPHPAYNMISGGERHEALQPVTEERVTVEEKEVE